jgi:putative transposase
MCRVLDVARAAYYAWRHRTPSRRAQTDTLLTLHIESIYWRSRRSYGSTRIHRDLRACGLRCSQKRVARLMRSRNLVARRRRKYRVTTQSGHRLPVAPNVLERNFAVATVQRPNRFWAGDITYIPTREGWLYLAVLLDLRSRRVIGRRAHSRLTSDLALDPLEQALQTRRFGIGLIAHSDRGVQYASNAYQELLHRHGIVCSMSRKGDCWDNAVVESFFSTLKCELVDSADWFSRREAEREINTWIDNWYNRQRRHSSLGYLSPVDFELRDELGIAT